MSDIAVSVRGLSKAYTIAHQGEEHVTLAESLLAKARRPFARAPKETFWALKDISFDIKKGAVVGIIGRNGAGKSTLLKILSRITEPTCGKAELYGRVGSLLEVGTGFHPELTGRENVFLNGAILGMSKREIHKQFNAIVDFAGVEKFLDTPVKRYSSGMYVRLAFAVAAHLEPEILIVDEVLAVGDVEFQKKCLGKMKDVADQGRTILFVSHNMAAVQSLCSSGILLCSGGIQMQGPVPALISQYIDGYAEIASRPLHLRKDRGGTGSARVTDLQWTGADGNALHHVITGSECSLTMRYEGHQPLKQPLFKITIYNGHQQPVLHTNSGYSTVNIKELPPRGAIECRFRRLPITQGNYSLNVALIANGDIQDHVAQALRFSVESGDFYGNGRTPEYVRETSLCEHEWKYNAEAIKTSF